MFNANFQRKADRRDHVPLPGAVRGPEEVPCGKRGAFPIQEYVPGEECSVEV